MITKRDWQLQQLGIRKWALICPEIFRGEVLIKLPSHIRLLLVADSLPSMNHPIIVDVARSMKLLPAQLYWLKPEKVVMLSNSVRCHCWWIGVEVTRDLSGIILHTPPLATLLQDAIAKRELWRQISDSNNGDSIINTTS